MLPNWVTQLARLCIQAGMQASSMFGWGLRLCWVIKWLCSMIGLVSRIKWGSQLYSTVEWSWKLCSKFV